MKKKLNWWWVLAPLLAISGFFLLAINRKKTEAFKPTEKIDTTKQTGTIPPKKPRVAGTIHGKKVIPVAKNLNNVAITE